MNIVFKSEIINAGSNMPMKFISCLDKVFIVETSTVPSYQSCIGYA